jgi:hypothetical protein
VIVNRADLDEHASKISSELADHFEIARSLVSAWFRSIGRPTTVSADRIRVIANEDNTGWNSDWVSVEENALRHPFRFAIPPLAGEWTARARSIAERMLALGATLQFQPFAPPGLDLIVPDIESFDRDDPTANAMLQFVVAPARWYLGSLASVDYQDTTLCQQTADDVLAVARTGRFFVRCSIPIDGLVIEEDLVESSLRLRRLTPLERGAFLDQPLQAWRSPIVPTMPNMNVFAPTVLLEVDVPWSDVRLFGLAPVPAMITAMHLHRLPVYGTRSFVRQIVPEWLSGSTMGGGQTSLLPVAGTTRVPLSKDQFAAVCVTLEKLTKYRIDSPENAAELALRRFSLGCSRQDPADALVDFVIALEALLLPGSSRSEMAFRFRMHGAHYMSTLPGERATIERQLNELYDVRSRLVHGGTPPTPENVNSAVQQARSLAAKGLLRAVDDVFPDDVFFRRALLGEA